MLKQATTFELARLLMSSQDRATEFRNEVNWLLRERGHQPAALEQIRIAVSHLDGFTVTSQQVADCIAGPAAEAVDLAEETQCDELLSDVDESDLVVITPPVIAGREDIFGQLINSNPTKVTYAQIEQVMMDLGLDPAVHEDDYLWVLDRLDERGILVVEALDGVSGSELDVVATLQENRAEIDKILLRIFGHSSNGDSELLTSEEQLRLLEVVEQGRQAAEQLDEDTPEEY